MVIIKLALNLIIIINHYLIHLYLIIILLALKVILFLFLVCLINRQFIIFIMVQFIVLIILVLITIILLIMVYLSHFRFILSHFILNLLIVHYHYFILIFQLLQASIKTLMFN